MALIASPYGARPYNKFGNAYNDGTATRTFPVINNQANAYFTGMIVALNSSGEVVPVTTPAGAAIDAASPPVGVVVGINFVPPGPLTGAIQDGFLPANAISAGYTNVSVMVCDDPDQLYMVQGNAQISATLNTALAARGENIALAASPGAGSTVTKNSTMAVAVAGRGAAAPTNVNNFCFRIVDFASPANDPFPDLVVRFTPGTLSIERGAGV